MDIIKEESGTPFDPEVVESFLNASDEALAISLTKMDNSNHD